MTARSFVESNEIRAVTDRAYSAFIALSGFFRSLNTARIDLTEQGQTHYKDSDARTQQSDDFPRAQRES
jgi:hypothetical protein